jgi:hypothetical protein
LVSPCPPPQLEWHSDVLSCGLSSVYSYIQESIRNFTFCSLVEDIQHKTFSLQRPEWELQPLSFPLVKNVFVQNNISYFLFSAFTTNVDMMKSALRHQQMLNSFNPNPHKCKRDPLPIRVPDPVIFCRICSIQSAMQLPVNFYFLSALKGQCHKFLVESPRIGLK